MWHHAVRLFQYVQRDLGSLWVGSLALLQIVLADRWLRVRGEPYEWAQFLLLGVLYPSLLLTLLLLRRWSVVVVRVFPILQLLLATVGAWWVLRYGRGEFQRWLVLICILQVALVIFLNPRALRPTQTGGSSSQAMRALVLLVLTCLSWVATLGFVWWRPVLSWIQSSWYTLLIFLSCLLLVSINLFYPRPAVAADGRRWRWPANALALLLLAWASFRIEPFELYALHHWGAILGPADLIRQGGWPLWDVPCQYGLLSTLVLAWLPVKSVWQALYVVNAILLWGVGTFLFLLLRSLRPGLANYLFAFGITLSAVFLLTSFPPESLTGSFPFPNVGPFRFFWCYALLAVLLWDFQAGRGPERQRRIMSLGCLVWLLGCLWSCESAVYTSVIWLPAYGLMVWRYVTARHPDLSFSRRLLRWTAGWVLPASLLLSTIGGISVWYRIRLGHGPDWRCFYEYCLAFQSGFGSLPIRLQGGPVWSLLLVFCVLTTLVVEFIRRGQGLRALGSLGGAWGAVWASASYYIGRSHDCNVTNLTPIWCGSIALALFLLTRLRTAERVALLAKVSLTPLLTLVLTTVFLNDTALMRCWSDWRKGYIRHVERRLPLMNPALLELWHQAEVQPDDPVVCIDVLPMLNCPQANQEPQSHYQTWLPASNFALLPPLTEERRCLYMDRFTRRCQRGGWLVRTKRPYNEYYADAQLLWFYGQLERTHRPTRVFENSDWQLTWFELKEPNARWARSNAGPEHPGRLKPKQVYDDRP